jgi:multiple antibiotic resistance protein
MEFNLKEFLTLSFTLFAVIDILGTIPLLISIKKKMGDIHPFRVTLISGGLMVLFFFVGKPLIEHAGC